VTPIFADLRAAGWPGDYHTDQSSDCSGTGQPFAGFGWNSLPRPGIEDWGTCHAFNKILCEQAPSGVAAVGDPHLQNVRGDRFDVMQEGNHVLINIPRGMSAETSLLRVTAAAVRLGRHCADMYFQVINITGSWAEAKHVGGYHYSVSQGVATSGRWAAFGKVELKVVHGRMESGITYLNFYAKHLGRTGFDVGGLLGLDDHDDVMTPPAACFKQMSLKALKTTETSLQSFPNSASSVAMTTFE